MKKQIKSAINRLGYSVARAPYKAPVRAYVERCSPSGLLSDDKLKEILAFFDTFGTLYDGVTGPLAIGGVWREFILRHRREQLRVLQESGSEREANYRRLLEGMFRNDLIWGLWNYAQFGTSDYVPETFLRTIDDFCYFTGRDVDSLCAPGTFGNPWGLKVNGGIVNYVDTWHGIQADSVIKLLGVSTPRPRSVVVDLGSGFGGTATKLARWFDRPCLYVLVDIPINLTTVYAYISASFPGVPTTLVTTREELTAALRGDQTAFVFVPTLLVEALQDMEISVLLNAGSLSEMDLATIEFYLRNLIGRHTDWFIEWNSNMNVRHAEGHAEIPSSKFPVPATHRLLSRHSLWKSEPTERYLASTWVNTKFFAPAPRH